MLDPLASQLRNKGIGLMQYPLSHVGEIAPCGIGSRWPVALS